VMPAPDAAPRALVGLRASAVAGRAGEAQGRLSAATLLRQARAAATAGRGAEAVALYRKLQRDLPASTEALVSAVPLGRLLLERAAPQAALTEFNRYLGGAAGGALVPEALYGRAQALARVGDGDQERATWRRLVADFPDSPYSAVARRRLSERP
jgi:TolA-binding protein